MAHPPSTVMHRLGIRPEADLADQAKIESLVGQPLVSEDRPTHYRHE